MVDLNKLTLAAARPLPVIVLADVSGSMSENGKIDTLNKSIQDMAREFADVSTSKVEIQLAVIAFGGEKAWLHRDLTPASKFTWTEMTASGKTPLGQAFLLAKGLVEDKDKISTRAYIPSIILASDARPTDVVPTPGIVTWKEALEQLLSSNYASRASRFALAIGDDADIEVMKAFLDDPDARIFLAREANDISRYFKLITFRVSQRSRSSNPNVIPPTDSDGFDY